MEGFCFGRRKVHRRYSYSPKSSLKSSKLPSQTNLEMYLKVLYKLVKYYVYLKLFLTDFMPYFSCLARHNTNTKSILINSNLKHKSKYTPHQHNTSLNNYNISHNTDELASGSESHLSNYPLMPLHYSQYNLNYYIQYYQLNIKSISTLLHQRVCSCSCYCHEPKFLMCTYTIYNFGLIIKYIIING